MIFYDIHTHHLPIHPEDVAIVSHMVPALGTKLCEERALSPLKTAGNTDCLSVSTLNRYVSVGVHPWYIANVTEQLAELRRMASIPAVVAIGETGLDKGVETPLDSQLEIFETSASLAESIGVFLIIHCVKAWDELIISKKRLKPRIPWVIHGFRGNATLARQLIRQGFFLSFGEHFNSGAVHEAWPNHLFAETDDREIDIRAVYRNLSTSLDLQLEQFTNQVTENIHNILRLS